MEILKFAGIDIGSNAIRLIVKDVLPGKTYKHALLKKIAYLRLPLRLGGDVFKYGEIRQKKANDFINALKIYYKLMKFYNVTEFRACATSATRSAENGEEILKRAENETGIKIDVIDGVEESMLLYETNKYNLPEGETFLSVDLGGGSLQTTLFQGDNLIWTHSYKIGTVRILNNVVNPAEIDAMKTKMKELGKEYKNLHLIGSGGNINKISKMLGEKKVEYSKIEKLYKELEPLTPEKRMLKYGLRYDRADVIIPAADTYLKVMKYTKSEKIFVPKIGLSDGIIRQIYEQYTEK